MLDRLRGCVTCVLPCVRRLAQLLGLSTASQLTQATFCGIALDLQRYCTTLDLLQHRTCRIKVCVGCLAVHSMLL